MRGISGLFQNYNVGMLLLEGPRRRLKGSKETSTKLCVMKRLLSIAEATAHEITPGDYAKKKEVLQRQRGWAQGSRTASSGIWPPHCNTTFGSQTSGQNGPAWRWPLQYLPTNGVPKCNQVAGVSGFHPLHCKMCIFCVVEEPSTGINF